MNIDAKKINALEGSWVDADSHGEVYPRFDNAFIPIFRQEVLPLTQLHNDKYWWELRSSHKIDMAVLDHRHWYYEDEVFEKYVERIASIDVPIICLSESPFGFERPQIDLKTFAEKLFERTQYLVHLVRKDHRKTTILSPGIGVMNENYRRFYLDFFVQNHRLFDGYALHVCNNLREHTLGQIASFLNQVMKLSAKPLWITKWAVPTFEGKIINTQVIGETGWEPYTYSNAVKRLIRSFVFFEDMASSGSYWFYTGTGKDIYKPRRVIGPKEFWEPHNSSVISEPEDYTPDWDYRHFLGMLTADGAFKEKFFKGLLNLAAKNNG